MQIDTEIYKKFEIQLHYLRENGMRYFYAGSILGFSVMCSTHEEAINQAKTQIDEFVKNSPKTYAELAEAITKTLVWTNNEPEADEFIIKTLVEQFMINNKL